MLVAKLLLGNARSEALASRGDRTLVLALQRFFCYWKLELPSVATKRELGNKDQQISQAKA